MLGSGSRGTSDASFKLLNPPFETRKTLKKMLIRLLLKVSVWMSMASKPSWLIFTSS